MTGTSPVVLGLSHHGTWPLWGGGRSVWSSGGRPGHRGGSRVLAGRRPLCSWGPCQSPEVSRGQVRGLHLGGRPWSLGTSLAASGGQGKGPAASPGTTCFHLPSPCGLCQEKLGDEPVSVGRPFRRLVWGPSGSTRPTLLPCSLGPVNKSVVCGVLGMRRSHLEVTLLVAGCFWPVRASTFKRESAKQAQRGTGAAQGPPAVGVSQAAGRSDLGPSIFSGCFVLATTPLSPRTQVACRPSIPA